MLQIILRRLLIVIPTLVGISILAFSLIRLVPGDPVDLMLGERGASQEVRQELRARMGLNEPLWRQYSSFVFNAIQGDFGESLLSRRSVFSEFIDRLTATAELGIVAVFFAILVGIPIGILAAAYRSRWLDKLLMGSAVIGYSMPIFWWGLLMILWFSVELGWTPVSGRLGFLYEVEQVTGFLLVDSWMSPQGFSAFLSAVHHLLLPSIVLATIPLAAVARMTRASLLEVLNEDYIRTARAKGVAERLVLFHHALKNALIPIVTVIGIMVGTILTGAILTETLFSWPGLGRWLVASVEGRDYPVIQGGILLIAFLIIGVNLIVDVLYYYLNPKMRDML